MNFVPIGMSDGVGPYLWLEPAPWRAPKEIQGLLRPWRSLHQPHCGSTPRGRYVHSPFRLWLTHPPIAAILLRKEHHFILLPFARREAFQAPSLPRRPRARAKLFPLSPFDFRLFPFSPELSVACLSHAIPIKPIAFVFLKYLRGRVVTPSWRSSW
jgi:hypothetical protein